MTENVWDQPFMQFSEEEENFWLKWEEGESKTLKWVDVEKKQQKENAKFKSEDGMEWFFRFTENGQPRGLTTFSKRFLKALKDVNAQVDDVIVITRSGKGYDYEASVLGKDAGFVPPPPPLLENIAPDDSEIKPDEIPF